MESGELSGYISLERWHHCFHTAPYFGNSCPEWGQPMNPTRELCILDIRWTHGICLSQNAWIQPQLRLEWYENLEIIPEMKYPRSVGVSNSHCSHLIVLGGECILSMLTTTLFNCHCQKPVKLAVGYWTLINMAYSMQKRYVHTAMAVNNAAWCYAEEISISVGILQ